MANYIKEVTNMLGVGLGEAFKMSGCEDVFFSFGEDSLSCGDNPNHRLQIIPLDPQDLVDMLTGKRRVIKYIPKPKYGDTYYIVCPTNIRSMYEIKQWTGCAMDEEYYERGLVFTIKAMAFEAAKSVIAMLRGSLTPALQGTNHMDEVVEMLGVGYDETFQLKNAAVRSKFKFKADGLYLFSTLSDDWYTAPGVLYKLITGEYTIRKPRKFPVVGTEYFLPNPTVSSMCTSTTWNASEADVRNLDNGLVCLTKEKAIEVAKKMLKVAEDEY